jgi:Rps23 Pro-64 3,4-dihydroxylase Tpa1-like proline 4-hydroxylase
VAIGFNNNTVLGDVRVDVKVGMFPGGKVEVKLYKLAVYEPGGHFDWHMDSTHSDEHHATLLVALNTSWKGSDLILQCIGIETHINLQPQSSEKGEPILQAVAFFTDTEHRIEPVKEGVHIVFQYES